MQFRSLQTDWSFLGHSYVSEFWGYQMSQLSLLDIKYLDVGQDLARQMSVPCSISSGLFHETYGFEG